LEDDHFTRVFKKFFWKFYSTSDPPPQTTESSSGSQSHLFPLFSLGQIFLLFFLCPSEYQPTYDRSRGLSLTCFFRSSGLPNRLRSQNFHQRTDTVTHRKIHTQSCTYSHFFLMLVMVMVLHAVAPDHGPALRLRTLNRPVYAWKIHLAPFRRTHLHLECWLLLTSETKVASICLPVEPDAKRRGS